MRVKSVWGGWALLFLVTLIIPPLNGHAQERSERVFDAVPLDSRGRLIERLNEYVAHEKRRVSAPDFKTASGTSPNSQNRIYT